MQDDVLRKEAIVHGLLMDGVADDHDLIKLSVQSGGDFCIYEDSGSGGIDYYQCMMDIISNFGSFSATEVSSHQASHKQNIVRNYLAYCPYCRFFLSYMGSE